MVELYLFASLRSKWLTKQQNLSKRMLRNQQNIIKPEKLKQLKYKENIQKNYNSSNEITITILLLRVPSSSIQTVRKLYNLRHIRD